MKAIKDQLLERFLCYASYDTQSDPAGDSTPSTPGQFVLLNLLLEEIASLGLSDCMIDPHGYVTGTIPATPGCERAPVIGLIAHVDTSPDMSGARVRPQVIVDYDGGDIPLGDSVVMRAADFPELAGCRGHTLITSDGTTLLGADDKAGVAEIVTAAAWLLAHPEIPHGKIRIAFTPDEEIGRGADFFDIPAFGAQVAYTVDGGAEGELEYENFNGAEARITVRGRNVHPGYAKGKMINALRVATEFDSLLPPGERPEQTEGREGFFHLTALGGDVECAEMEYILRDFDRINFESRKVSLEKAAGRLNEVYGAGTITMRMQDQYYNMREKTEPFPGVVEKAREAMRQAGVTPVEAPIRGGTDGARLSWMGLPCPNLFTGAVNMHGRFESCSLDTMEKSVMTLVNLARLWAAD